MSRVSHFSPLQGKSVGNRLTVLLRLALRSPWPSQKRGFFVSLMEIPGKTRWSLLNGRSLQVGGYSCCGPQG